MKLSFFLLVITVFAQKEVTIFSVPDDTKVALLEAEIIKNSFKLYNAHNQNEQLTYKMKLLNKFYDVFVALDETNNKDYVFSAYQITITTERQKKYDFSSPYLPIKESIYTLSKRKDLNFKKGGIKLAYQKGSTQEKQITRLKKFKIKPVVFNIIGEKIVALKNGDVDFVIGDNIEIWGKNELKVVSDMEIQPGSGFGFMFVKGSGLKAKLDPYIQKYVQSQSFFSFLIRNFGKKVAAYYRENLKNSTNSK